MALVLKDRVRESSTTSGTGSITLAGALPGYQTFATAITSGSTVYYTIHNTTAPNDTEWEVGVGTFTSPSTLSRDTVFSSSAGGAKVSFSSASTLEVFITQPAEQAIYVNEATGKVEVFGNGTNTVSFTSINTTNLTANTISLTAGTITTNAANATDITNKTYVDGLFSTGISYHTPVRVESPTNLNATYNNGTAGVGATLTNAGTQAALVIDGVTLSVNDRVLIYTQTDQTQNGIYTVTNVGSGSTNWVLTRATDANSYGVADPNKLGQGDAVFVQQGNTGAGETYVCNTAGTITFGTTNITFVQISSAQVYSAGTGLNLSNLTFSIANTTVVTGLYGDSANVAVIEVNSQGQLTSASNAAINVSNITVGTLSNDRTTANASNGANTIVLRDSTGSFNANVVTATTVNATSGNFTNISANGSGITAINASNITSGTIANARTTGSTSNSASTIVLRDANGSFGANIISGSFSGDGSAVNAINASNISSGTIANARTTAASANGASTIVQRDSGGSFTANVVTATHVGDGSGLSAINASNISSGTIANARTTASSSNGASTIVLRDAGGAFAAGAITGTSFSGNGASITDINASSITTGTIANARTTASSANGASTIVSRDSGGNFSANTITANLTGTASSATTATNQSGGTVSATTGAFSSTITSSFAPAAINTTTPGLTNYGFVFNGAASADNAQAITWTWATGGTAQAGIYVQSSGAYGTKMYLGTTDSFAAGSKTAISIDHTGLTNFVRTRPTALGNTILDAGNYNSYAPTLTGTGASGTWGINITGSAGSATTATTATNWGAYGAVPAAGTSFGNANTIGRSDANGYVYTNYINSNTANSENPTVSQVIVTNGGDNFYRKASIAHLTGSLSGTAPINISGNAVNLSTNRTNWSTNGTITAVVGQLAWKNYGNNHTIFDASNGTAPDGSAVNNTNSQVEWTGTYPTLMGWNGANTYGVRVDWSRRSEYLVGTWDTSGRNYSREWIEMPNHSGLYSALNGAYFYPNNASYGSWRVAGSRNGWAGLEFDPPSGGGTTLMMNRDAFGFHMNDTGWRFYNSGGSGYFPGEVQAGYSDKRLKENFRPMTTEALDIVNQLQTYRFNWNAKVKEMGLPVAVGKEEVGCIAQDVQAVFPDAVAINKSANIANPDGTEIETDYLTINYNKLTPLLIQAVNELTKQVKELQAEIAILKG